MNANATNPQICPAPPSLVPPNGASQGTEPGPLAPQVRHDRLPEIEVLRAIAVGAVMLHHAQGNLLVAPHRLYDALMRHADFSTGVDLFFAISGFVIARSLLPALWAARGLHAGATLAGSFWIRRAFRLMPSAWLWLGLILLLSASFNRAGLFGPVQANAWAMLAGMLNYANIRFADTFMRAPYGASFAWWSLSLEEQFYLLLPPLAFLLGRRCLPPLLLLAVAWQACTTRSIYGMVFRTDAILLGVVLAVWSAHPSYATAGRWAARLPRFAQAILAGGLLVALVTRQHALRPPDIGLMAMFSCALVFLAAQNRGLILRDGWARRLLVAIGARSYALYLVHVPAYFAARELWLRIGNPSTEIPVALTALLILALAAEANWRLVEQPMRRRGARMAAGFTAPRQGIAR